MKKFVAILLALVFVCGFSACKKKDDNNTESKKPVVDNVYESGKDSFTFSINESGDYDIVKYESKTSEVREIVIPSVIDNIPVTGIAADTFKACNTVSAFTIPDSIKTIGNYAFFGCELITSITLPDSITSLGTGVFQNCKKLQTVKLSNKIKEIPDDTFKDCVLLTSVSFPSELLTIGARAYYNCDALTEITIPATVTKIGDTAFYSCDSLVKATVYATTTELGEMVFKACNENLTLYGDNDSKFKEYAELNNYKYSDIPQA